MTEIETTTTIKLEGEVLNELFRKAMQPLEKLPAGSYFVYGSTALDAREGAPVYGAEKVRFKGLGKMRDIDVAVYDDAVGWEDVVGVAGDIYSQTEGRYCMDPHFIHCEGDRVEIKGISFPKNWLTTETVYMGDSPIQVVEPVSAILIRLLHGDPRVRDTKRIIHEIGLLPNIRALNDERIIFGLNNLVHSPNFPHVATVGVAKLVMGLLPTEIQESIRTRWRKKDLFLGTNPIRQQPEFL